MKKNLLKKLSFCFCLAFVVDGGDCWGMEVYSTDSPDSKKNMNSDGGYSSTASDSPNLAKNKYYSGGLPDTNARLDIVEDKNFYDTYKKELISIANSLSEKNIMQKICQENLYCIINKLDNDSISDDDYNFIYSCITSILPEFSGNQKILLDTILVISLFHLLNAGIYASIGSSFIPNNDELQSIKLNGIALTKLEFIKIQSILDEKAEHGKLDANSFTEAVNIVNISRQLAK